MNQDELLTERQNERESVKQTYRYTGRQKDEKTKDEKTKDEKTKKWKEEWKGFRF